VSIDLGSYNDVASRMREFFEKHPDGRLRPASPWRVETIGDKAFVVFEAAAYRAADDPNPGIGTAWEPFPGRTQFTRDSELMNAETSAWGRAILAVGAADTRKGVASAEEVRNRHADQDVPYEPPAQAAPTPASVRTAIAKVGKARGLAPDRIAADFAEWSKGGHIGVTEDVRLLTEYLNHMQEEEHEPR
jgi:hypothetical protein